jgi:hypothetical protein
VGSPRDGDADARPDLDLRAAPSNVIVIGSLTAPIRPPAEGHQVAVVPDALDEDDELVPTEPGHELVVPYLAREAAGDLAQQGVAGGVAERVVDRLEPVEIDEEQAGPVPFQPSPVERRGRRVERVGPVGQAGELVVRGLVRQLQLQLLAFADGGDDLRHRGVHDLSQPSGRGSCNSGLARSPEATAADCSCIRRRLLTIDRSATDATRTSRGPATSMSMRLPSLMVRASPASRPSGRARIRLTRTAARMAASVRTPTTASARYSARIARSLSARAARSATKSAL